MNPRRLVVVATAVVALVVVGAAVAQYGRMLRTTRRPPLVEALSQLPATSEPREAPRIPSDQGMDLSTLTQQPTLATETTAPTSAPSRNPLNCPWTTTTTTDAADANPRQRRNLIIGLAGGYGREDLFRFSGSARAFMPPHLVEVVLLALPDMVASPELRLLTSLLNTTMVVYDAARYGVHGMAVHLRRYYAIAEYIARWDEECFADVFMTDIRDVLFQGDVFAAVRRSAPVGFVGFQEPLTKLIGQCEANSKWVDRCFGRAVLAAYAQKPIICSGTQLASVRDTKTYLRVLLKIADASSPICRRLPGVDQGMHNHIIYADLLRPNVSHVTVQRAEDGDVYTMHNEPDVRIDVLGRVVNRVGAVPAVIHQYDRWTPLAQFVKKRFAVPRVGGGYTVLNASTSHAWMLDKMDPATRASVAVEV